jgi:hypothetical protein
MMDVLVGAALFVMVFVVVYRMANEILKTLQRIWRER